MAKPKSKRQVTSLRLIAVFALAGLGISMFVIQGAAAATADEEALSFNPFALGTATTGVMTYGYVPPTRIPYRPPLRSPYRPPL